MILEFTLVVMLTCSPQGTNCASEKRMPGFPSEESCVATARALKVNLGRDADHDPNIYCEKKERISVQPYFKPDLYAEGKLR